MRTKDEILKQVGELAIESPRSGVIPDLADVMIIEVLIDIRDQIHNLVYLVGSNMDTELKESLKTAGLWPK